MGDNRVWVGGLPADIKEPDLTAAFAHCGKITSTNVKYGKNDTFGFITFEDPAGFERALKDMDQSRVFGQPIKVNLVTPGGTKAKGGGKGEEGPSYGGGDDRRDGGRRDDRPRSRERPRSRPRDPDRDRRDDRDRDRERPRDRRDDRNRDPPRGNSFDLTRDSPPRRDSDRRGGDDRRGDYRDDDRRRDSGRGDDRGGGDRDRDRDRERDRRDRYDDRDRQDRDRRDDRDDRRDSCRQRDEHDRRDGGNYRDDRQRQAPVQQAAPINNRVWLGGLPSHITEEEIMEHFALYGPPREVFLKQTERDTYAFVTYDNEQTAEATIAEYDQRLFMQKKIKCSWPKFNPPPSKFTPPPQAPPPGRGRSRSPLGRGGDGRVPNRLPPRVNVGNLPPDMHKQEFYDIVSAFGRVLFHDLWDMQRDGIRKGLVEYASERDAHMAVDELADRRIEGWARRLTANLSV
eukprot:TRINITY_DN100494_c0_g1_i1.p1 TRINITY_DN100494_c0_g1~~TRINITY_DN100494_c0_g1_i1.p1  ORF type:complete len:458 (-),score=52.62 TRINITY_DN100494_c0_g1_i1:100-1473(-)